MPWITDTTLAAALASKNQLNNEHNAIRTLISPAGQYNYIIAPHRESLKSLLTSSNTSSNVTEGSHLDMQRIDTADDTESPGSDKTCALGRKYSSSNNNGPHVGEPAFRLDPVQSMEIDDPGNDNDGNLSDDDDEEDGFKKMMFTEF